MLAVSTCCARPSSASKRPEPMPAVRTTCAYCGVGCGIRARTTGERKIEITGDRDHPANHGRLCSKGTHLGETVGLEGRLLYPEVGGKDRKSTRLNSSH